MEDYRLIEIEEEEEMEEEEEEGEGEEVGELIPVARMIPRGPTEDEDEDEDEDYEDENEDEEDYEEEEVEDLIPVEMTSPSVSSSIADGRNLQGAVVINDGLLDDSNHLESCAGKSGNQENGGGDGGKEELNRGEIDGLFCPICFEAWTSGGEHQICCLPCGHIYGLSCIKKWLQRRQSSGKCPQCNSLCTLKDLRVLYATRLCVADEELQKRVRLLEAKCAYLEQKSGVPLYFEQLRDDFEQLRDEFSAWRIEAQAQHAEIVVSLAENKALLLRMGDEFASLKEYCNSALFDNRESLRRPAPNDDDS